MVIPRSSLIVSWFPLPLPLLGRGERMSGAEYGKPSKSPKIDTHVAKVQCTAGRTPEGWEECWVQGLTLWNLGKPTPIILHLLQTEALPKGRTLIPGCGRGHDVVAIAEPERYVVGLDVSETAIKTARELSAGLPNANNFTFLKEDFFNWHPSELFDLIFDYSFFCAIEPDKRLAWAKQISNLLKPDGELITLMYPIDDHVGGPPYKVSVQEYEEVLNAFGFEACYVEDNELAIESRKGREKLGRWKRSSKQSRV